MTRLYQIRPATVADAPAISALLLPLVERFIAPDCTAAGAHLIAESMQEAALRTYLLGDYRYWLAESVSDPAADLLGVVAFKGASHLYHLFVAEQAQQRGLARALWQHALNQMCQQAVADGAPLDCITVNASLHAEHFYRRLGFTPLSGPRERMGVVDVPMQLLLSSA